MLMSFPQVALLAGLAELLFVVLSLLVLIRLTTDSAYGVSTVRLTTYSEMHLSRCPVSGVHFFLPSRE